MPNLSTLPPPCFAAQVAQCMPLATIMLAQVAQHMPTLVIDTAFKSMFTWHVWCTQPPTLTVITSNVMWA